MEYQLNLFADIEDFNPLREVAKRATVYGTNSKAKIVEDASAPWAVFVDSVHQEYCPYGGAGYYGFANKCPDIYGYDLRAAGIKVYYLDAEGHKREQQGTWAEFARCVMDLISSGQYGG